MAKTGQEAAARGVAPGSQVDRPDARDPDHPDLADRLGAGVARLARRQARAAAPRQRSAPPRSPRPLTPPPRPPRCSPAKRSPRCASTRTARPVVATAIKAAEGAGPPGPHQPVARPARRRLDRPRQRQQRRGAGDARPPRQPDGARLGPHHRRLGRRVHVRLVPQRHLAVVAAVGQRRDRPQVEAPQHAQRQPPLHDRFLDPVPAGDAQLHRRVDQLPQGLRPVRVAPRPRRRRNREAAARARPLADPATGVDQALAAARPFATGRARRRQLADRPEARVEDRLSSARAARPK